MNSHELCSTILRYTYYYDALVLVLQNFVTKCCVYLHIGLDNDDRDSELPVSYAESDESSPSITITSSSFGILEETNGTLGSDFEQLGLSTSIIAEAIFMLSLSLPMLLLIVQSASSLSFALIVCKRFHFLIIQIKSIQLNI